MRLALVARFGYDAGREATAEAFTYAWEHWGRVGRMANAAGYTYRVGERVGRRLIKRRTAVVFAREDQGDHSFEPGLAGALERLSPRQRSCVVLVHGLGWTQVDAAELLSLSPSSVQKHVERGLEKLRDALGVTSEA